MPQSLARAALVDSPDSSPHLPMREGPNGLRLVNMTIHLIVITKWFVTPLTGSLPVLSSLRTPWQSLSVTCPSFQTPVSMPRNQPTRLLRN